ncbi:MAG: hypothetical protein V1903_01290 [Bacteroidota bacterium]
MKFIKQYGIVFSVFLLVLLLVLIRTFNNRNFRYDSVKWAEPSAMGTNMLSEDQVNALDGKKLLVDLGKEAIDGSRFQDIIVKMDPELVLEKQNLKLIRKNKGPVILYSKDISVSAKIWMLLSEMGIKDVFILYEAGDK